MFVYQIRHFFELKSGMDVSSLFADDPVKSDVDTVLWDC